MCDEYTNISNKEQLSFCIRWVDKQLQVHEDVIGFYKLTDMKVTRLSVPLNIFLYDYSCHYLTVGGKTYDGARNMLGRKSGVATQISNIQPKAFVNHCHVHSLSLTVKDVTSNCNILNDVMSIVGGNSNSCKIFSKT